MKLNKQQVEAVKFKDGYGFVTAVPGSGKTRVLTERAVELLSNGVSPFNILCITFTNKAAREMRGRVERRLGKDASKLWISTFHSMGAKILRKEIAKVPHYSADFTIIDPDDQLAIIEKGAEALGYGVKNKKNKDGVDARYIMGAINAKKDMLTSDEEFKENHDPETCQIFDYYKQYLIRSNCMDFGDLLYILYLLLFHKKSVRRKYGKRFQYIMVDECQDLNYCQYEIVKMLAEEHNNLVLIGDCDQSIYRFRQADPKHVKRFLGEMEVNQLPLSYNYRSTKNIIRCAEAVIKNNSSRVSDKLDTVNEDGEFVSAVTFYDYMNESKWVANEIENLRTHKGYEYSDFALLYRTNAMSRSFEQDLRIRGIPCKVIGGKSFFDLVTVKTCINYLQFYLNPNNVLAFHKIINKPRRSIAAEITNTIEKYCFNHGCTIIEAIENIDSIDIDKIGAKRRAALSHFYDVMKQQEDLSGPIFPIAERIFNDSGLVDYFEQLDSSSKKSDKQGRSGSAEIYQSFMTMIKEWDNANGGGIAGFLEHINLQTSNDQVDESDCVKLMTLHTSKGLEFPVVFVVAVEEDLIPHKFSLESQDPEDVEEERRLFYVGMTRAKKLLYLTTCKKRATYGKIDMRVPSRFLHEAKRGGAIVSVAGDENTYGGGYERYR